MYYDLFLPFPTNTPVKKKGKGKGKGNGKALDAPERPSDCWAGLSGVERDRVARGVAVAGHLGYTVVAHTITAEQSNHVLPCPFGSPETRLLPYPDLDPRMADAGPSNPSLVQVTRYHMRLDDGKVHPITASNTLALRDYDILSCYVGSDKALQRACTDLSVPGPNQLAIITVPLHERPYHFRLNSKQIRQAHRNGVVFEILYAAGLFPPRSTPPEVAKQYRQNFLSNARELVRVTGGKGIIFSSGPGGSDESLRGPLDVVNLATILGVPANLAKDALSHTAKSVLLRAQARKTYKAVLGQPHIVPPPGIPTQPEEAEQEEEEDSDVTMSGKRSAPQGGQNKKARVA
ncbi:hypothetical protein CcaverHIS002_0401420 [Cutaneotrichosporon cavernicola]|uniref:PHP domain-like protein n=1 Tax=Cutaneotrichosporon cavernicola TaxID=279322 RepID=A0AA48L3L6_9TREE|nr:uncharacterized protein CcaverHIS019_0401380 [Cutaneotrichosporon cavernicola]BEI83538.1 hypothetical protein CcaverHIS002_0401420 [Cutaneotrichosporon cavernicola]BEI91318.1 hypothetical protein CcaverHIS019_0401380 [Cutaneotrichosporon cavernicola]BEI99091.1 hypothetical protein CcaverHIS631_0401340 [Cutaneotrichosporon cavernicola]